MISLDKNFPEPEMANCPLCSNGEFHIIYSITYNNKEEFKLVKCHGCGLAYLNPRAKSADIKLYYPKSYYKVEESSEQAILETPYEREKLLLMKRFKILDNSKKSILDVGSNKGEFLNNLKKSGWGDLKGVEFDEDCARFSKEKYDLDIFSDKFEKYPEDSKFDIITFWHSLEHIYDINSAIGKTAGLLKQDGVIIISVPHIKSIQAYIMGKYWYHVSVPHHIAFFDKLTLGKLLKKHNFTIENSTSRYPSHNFDGWYNSALSIWNKRKCKEETGGMPRMQPGSKKGLSAHKTLMLLLFKLFMKFLSYAEMSLGSGGTITILARKSGRINARNGI